MYHLLFVVSLLERSEESNHFERMKATEEAVVVTEAVKWVVITEAVI